LTIADEIVCQCAQVRRSDIEELQRASPDITFDDVLQRSGAGTKCTACVLDIEYQFTTGLGGGGSSRQVRSVDVEGPLVVSEKRRSLRRVIYDLLDNNLAPRFRRRSYHAPVILADGIEQLCVLSNQGFTFAHGDRVPTYRVELVLRNAKGTLVASETHEVAPGEHFEHSISAMFPQAIRDSKTLSIGSITTVVEPRSSGLMGFPRPHIKILTKAGATSVHQHSPLRFREGYVTWMNQPDYQRMFLAFVNTWPWSVSCELDYPHVAQAGPIDKLVKDAIRVPARGAFLHEVLLDQTTRKELDGRRFSTRLRAPVSTGTIHMIYATPDLSTVSIDHVIFR
jgi:bacterioferritin-associated ferredoxin